MLHDCLVFFFFFQAEDGIRDVAVTGVQTCALPILGLIVPPQADAERPSARAKRTTRAFALSTEPYIPMPQGQGLYGSAGREEPDILLLVRTSAITASAYR